VVAGLHEQTDIPDLQDPKLAGLQQGAQAPWLADDLVRSSHDLGSCANRQAWPSARLQRRRDPDLPDDEGVVRGLDWAVPDFSTLSRRQKTLKVTIPYRSSDGPLHLLVDIEPVSATGSSEPARGHQGRGRRRVD